ncbi:MULTISPECIES: hypothetical protein [Hyphomicrobiales]|jgi:hypothetical protein|uniref:Uncharacterized protein n=3 Tax=Hyphomicrobiales TaxID=356 RepID=A0A6H0ZIG7_9HYPH|nr:MULTISPECIES: hypothetical protein [Hyphomicrobiales]KNY30995.1 hypothetical protein AKG12_26965 [Agrobacterium sp. SUL3]MCD4661086.1 hypothetical protein [Agrobacterium sp.]QCM13638.1 hypothetical protein CFBP6625_24680 [Agrobacterium tumefaciens]CAD7029358.1 hypothetical protein RP007_03721 [Rhizobium sp. P007]KAB2701978.1 hypothetical protein F9L03_20365 [Brucella lupini]
MLLLEVLLFSAAFVAVILLAAHQIVAQVREYRFYKSNGGDFTVDSGMDNLKLDERVYLNALGLTNWQRFYLFRPFYIVLLIAFAGMMLFSLF